MARACEQAVHDMTGKQGAGLFMCMFVTTVYEATVKQGAGLFMGVSL